MTVKTTTADTSYTHEHVTRHTRLTAVNQVNDVDNEIIIIIWPGQTHAHGRARAHTYTHAHTHKASTRGRATDRLLARTHGPRWRQPGDVRLADFR